MKVILISPYADLQAFGIRIISACLKREGHEVQMLFLPQQFTVQYEDHLLNEVVEFSKGVDLIGISVMTNFFRNVSQITLKLKDAYNIPVLWGGIHPTIRPEECLGYADMVCIGEGEEAIVELLNKMEKRQSYYDVCGIWFKNKGSIITNPLRSLPSLDHIPFQDYDISTHFISNNGRIEKLDIKLLREYNGEIYMTLPTRGCPFGCTYCCNNTLNAMYPHQKPLRKRSVYSIIEELSEIKAIFPFINCIKFDDDAFFTFSVEEIKEFCIQYKKLGLALIIGGVTPTTLDREKLSLLVDAGLNEFRMGIQTGNERTKKLYNRRYSNEQVERSVKIINEFKDRIVLPQFDILLDNPWETDEELIETLMFLSKLPPPYRLQIFSLTFYPGTELYKKAKMDGMITDDMKDVYLKSISYPNKTYLNRLFFLLSDYASNGLRIPSQIMHMLTNRNMRLFRLNWVFYVVLIMLISPFALKRSINLVQKGIKDVQNGDWFRIHRYIQKYFNA